MLTGFAKFPVASDRGRSHSYIPCTSWRHLRSQLLTLCEVNPPFTGGFLRNGTVILQRFLCLDNIASRSGAHFGRHSQYLRNICSNQRVHKLFSCTFVYYVEAWLPCLCLWMTVIKSFQAMAWHKTGEKLLINLMLVYLHQFVTKPLIEHIITPSLTYIYASSVPKSPMASLCSICYNQIIYNCTF